MEKAKVSASFSEQHVITEDSDEARELYAHSRFGSVMKGRVVLSMLEAFYLMEKGRLVVKGEGGRKLMEEGFLRKAKKIEQNFWVRYRVFADLRGRGYIVKTALKFGADFRVYDRGIKPGEDHAKWVVYPVHEGATHTWQGFSAKNRVAHSTKKKLMVGIVDDEGDVTYYEIRWLRP